MHQKNPHDLLAERGDLIDNMKAMLDRCEREERDLNSKEQAQYSAWEQKIDALKNRADRMEGVNALSADLDKPRGKSPRTPIGDNGSESRAAADKFFRTGDKSAIQNALTIGTDGDGGYTVIEFLAPTLFDNIAESNPIFRDTARVTTTSDNFKAVYAITGAASGRVAESASRAETNGPTYATQNIRLSMQYAHPQISEELLHASEYDIPGHVQREVNMAFDADFEAEFLNGNGTHPNQKGILTAADSTDVDGTRAFGSYQLVQGAGTGAVTYDEIVDLFHSLPPRYRRNAKLYVGTEIIQAMRLLKDGNALPLWRDTDGSVGRPQSLLGVEVVEVPAMPGFGASNKTMIYGDLNQAYAFASHSMGVQVQRDPYTTPGFVKFYTRLYCGSGPMDTRALKVFQQAAA